MKIPDPTAAAMSGDPEVFENFLCSGNSPYFLVDQATDQAAHIRFTGRFEGRSVVWDCQFKTLEAARASRNFIEIGEPDERGHPLCVGLSVARIDKPAIEKMIIMIRNYKHLRPGRHEYG